MNTTRQCGCKGYRSCFICEKECSIPSCSLKKELSQKYGENSYVFCSKCNKIVLHKTWDVTTFKECNELTNHDLDSKPFPGILILKDFVSLSEENELINNLDLLNWDMSQSGRRKQNFGPRANFKKRKTKAGDKFYGFPKCTKFIQERFLSVPCLAGYQTIEQCSIEYRKETGASIEPHVDDCWIWGERIVQLNMLSDSVLTCIPLESDTQKYNLSDVSTYPKTLDVDGKVLYNPLNNSNTDFDDVPRYVFQHNDISEIVRIPLPRRSLLVMYDSPRYQWEHCILREDISDRRIVIAYREFTPPYLPGGKDASIGAEIINRAQLFWE